MPRRVPKLPQAVLSQEQSAVVQGFSIADFTPFETLLGRSLNRVERGTLIEATQKYLSAKAIEINSPTVAAIKKHIAKVKKTAGALRQALVATDANSVGFFAGRAISERLKNRPFSRRIAGQVDSNTVALLMRDVERACDTAARSSIQLQEQSPSWVRLVHDLESWAQSASLSTKVSKRLQGKAGRLSLSPFVALVKVVQASFPAVYRQHGHSDDALSTAVSVAKRVVNPRNA
jgi:hypothetical protein